jgi:bifunctional DNA-binding transcriptional regulator/antitoxin component of YhaV-PrlF toxin-antitoxin module
MSRKLHGETLGTKRDRRRPEGELGRVGKRGTLVIPARLRRRYGMDEGASVLMEEHLEGVFVRPAVALPVRIYSQEEKAAFLLENAVDRQDYDRARDEVRRLGFDPDRIRHEPFDVSDRPKPARERRQRRLLRRS